MVDRYILQLLYMIPLVLIHCIWCRDCRYEVRKMFSELRGKK